MRQSILSQYLALSLSLSIVLKRLASRNEEEYNYEDTTSVDAICHMQLAKARGLLHTVEQPLQPWNWCWRFYSFSTR